MKTFHHIITLLILSATVAGCGSSRQVEGPSNADTQPMIQQEPVENYQVFYSALSPYGQWVEDPGYGYV
ncbi:MAG: hypothetical protein ACYCOO_10265, partial [Chitinophagaceae bacterium]